MQAFTVFEKLFKEYGLLGSIRSDNGAPFACTNVLYGLSSLSVRWLRLDIEIEPVKSVPDAGGHVIISADSS